MHKFRIACRVFLDGSTDYTPQYKGWFFWNNFIDFRTEYRYVFATLQEARDKIAKQIANERSRTVISTSVTYDCAQHEA